MIDKNTIIKGIVGVFVVLFLLGFLFGSDNVDNTASNDTGVVQYSSFREQVAHDLYDDDIFDVVGTGYNESSGLLIIEISSGYTGDSGLFQRTVTRTTCDIMESVVAHDYNITTVQVNSNTVLRNSKGNPVEVTSYVFETTMVDAMTVDWDYLRWSDDTVSCVEQNAGYFYINPALE